MKYRILIIGVLLNMCLISGCGKSAIPQKVLESSVKKEIGIAVEKKYPDYRNLKLESVKSVNAFEFSDNEAQCAYIAKVSFIAKGELPWSVDNPDFNNPKKKRMYHFADVEGTLRFLSSRGRWKCDRIKAPVVTSVTSEADRKCR